MKERPILFSAPMVRALLAGAKTQTRRIVKLNVSGRVQFGGKNWHLDDHDAVLACPYGQPCDRLWVKETTYNVEDSGWVGPVYVESDEGRQAAEWGCGESDDPDFIEPYDLKKRPSLFMTRARSRILLEVVSISVERLNSITVSNAIAEGYDGSLDDPIDPSIKWYSNLWESINGDGSWAANPWVWVVEFKRIDMAIRRAA